MSMPNSVSDGVLAKIAPLWLRWCFGGLRPTTGGGGRLWEQNILQWNFAQKSLFHVLVKIYHYEYLMVLRVFLPHSGFDGVLAGSVRPLVVVAGGGSQSRGSLPVTATPTYASN